MNEENKKVIVRKKKNGKKQLLVLALAGVLGCGGVLGASAFFTDHETTQATAKAGTFNMKVTDMSDLDGQYSDWSTGTQVKVLTAAGAQTDDARGAKVAGKEVYENAKDKDNPSTGIINPGDTGIYQYKIENTAEKSMDTAKVTKITLKLADDKTGKTLTAADANTYALDPTELGDSITGPKVITGSATVGADGKLEFTAGAAGNAIQLVYAGADAKILDGSIEKDSGVEAGQSSMIYAYNVDFARDAGNVYQGMQAQIDTTVYAKQHRNGINSTLTVEDNGSIAGTGDWAEIASFETVANA